MELIKMGNKYLVKDSGGKVIDEKERLELENKDLVIQDITSSGCVKEITKKIASNKKKIKELEEKEVVENEDKAIEETRPTD
jgi:hypothetical protein